MGQQCETCRHENSEWAQFCGQCGAQLAPHGANGTPPPPIPQALNDAAVLPRARTGGLLMTLAIIAMIGFGWLWVMMPASRRHSIPMPDVSFVPPEMPDVFGHHDTPTSPGVVNDDGNHAIARKTFQADDDIIDALYRLLRPTTVPIVVTRPADNRLSASGRPDDMAALEAFVRELNSTHSAMGGRQLTTYHLPPEQAKALEDVLGEARTRVTVRRDGSALHVRAPQAMHRSIDNLLRHIQSQMQTMVDISRPDY
ncbi:MAG: zinc ribbon domain-containing protein [Phycisphaerales bacterium]|nr:zinc ribbon domain-containing protein [Phycisphaerales bacterium]MCB9857151.1 zinc ribbon domain-containing protein [Phycisphaerales bacterium]MCB9861722.1 zinc ribbon domain-containing protein [Phycisphaerales bacterium]